MLWLNGCAWDTALWSPCEGSKNESSARDAGPGDGRVPARTGGDALPPGPRARRVHSRCHSSSRCHAFITETHTSANTLILRVSPSSDRFHTLQVHAGLPWVSLTSWTADAS